MAKGDFNVKCPYCNWEIEETGTTPKDWYCTNESCLDGTTTFTAQEIEEIIYLQS